MPPWAVASAAKDCGLKDPARAVLPPGRAISNARVAELPAPNLKRAEPLVAAAENDL